MLASITMLQLYRVLIYWNGDWVFPYVENESKKWGLREINLQEHFVVNPEGRILQELVT